MKQFEYKTVQARITKLITEEELASLGEEGWELSSSLHYGNNFVYYYFKREVTAIGRK